MPEDAVFNIIIGVQNRERITQLEKDIADAEKEIAKLSNTINVAGAATTQQANQLRMYGKDIQAYRQEISDLSKANIRLGESAETSQIGARTFTRSLYQMSEGAHGLMYTLPTLAQQMGASGELAIAIGAISVALVELGKQWDEIQDIFHHKTGLDAAKSNLEEISDWFKSFKGSAAAEMIGSVFSELAQNQVTKRQEAEAKKNLDKSTATGKSIVEGARSEEETRRGGVFRKAVGEYGGDRLFNEMLSTQVAGRNLTPNQEEEVKNEVSRIIAHGGEGKIPGEAMKGTFGPEFGKEFQSQQGKEDYKLEQRARDEEIRDARPAKH